MIDRYNDIPVLDEDIHQILRDNLNSSKNKTVFEKYIVLVDQIYQETMHYFKENNDEEFAKQCHKLKSSMESLGYLRLSKICRDIDMSFKSTGMVTEEHKKTFFSGGEEYETYQKVRLQG